MSARRHRKLATTIETWPLSEPFAISGKVFENVRVLVVGVTEDGCTGYGEAVGVYYHGDTAESLQATIEQVRQAIETTNERREALALLPPGGSRNALDCALWDLEAKLLRQPVWALAQLPEPKPVETVFTCGVDTPEAMANAALGYDHARAIKLKLAGDGLDAERVLSVRSARPDVKLNVDANQGLTRLTFDALLPVLVSSGVLGIEQPFPADHRISLKALDCPIPIIADESFQHAGQLEELKPFFSSVNIKLDKCGGLSSALKIVRLARQANFGVMVGNMIGTSLAMAPAFLVGQICDFADLDGPLFLNGDRANGVEYRAGKIWSAETVWGGTEAKTSIARRRSPDVKFYPMAFFR